MVEAVPKAEDLGLTREEFVQVAKIIKQEGYIDNVGIAATIVFLNNCNVTMKGHEFLESNSTWAKAYQGLKEIRDWLK
ncbi:YjcQ family protein [Paenibacillus donghaensis]|uniref:YjcQ family protein n=1 Tax=Paenibacillus donghaensis TaxID=414771 RepID=UPI0012F81A5D